MHSKEKIKKIRERALLREYINLHLSNILKEQDDGGYDSYYDDPTAGYGGGGYGGDPSGQNVMRLFGLDTVLNAARTLQYAAESTLNKAAGETRLLVKNFIYFAVPFIINKETPNLIDMANNDREKVKQRLEQIDHKYGEVLKNNNIIAELAKNPDFKVAAFLASPGLYLAAPLTKKSLGVISSTIDAIVPPRENYRKNDLLASLSELFAEDNSKRNTPNSPRLNEEQFRQLIVQELRRDPNIAAALANSNDTDISKMLSSAAVPTVTSAIPNAAAAAAPKTQITEQLQNPAPSILETPKGKEFVGNLRSYISFLKNPNELAKEINKSALGTEIQDANVEIINSFVNAAVNDINTNVTEENLKNRIKQNQQSIISNIEKRPELKDDPSLKNIKEKGIDSVLNDPELKNGVKEIRNNLINHYIKSLNAYEKQSTGPNVKGAIQKGIQTLNSMRSSK